MKFKWITIGSFVISVIIAQFVLIPLALDYTHLPLWLVIIIASFSLIFWDILIEKYRLRLIRINKSRRDNNATFK